MAKCYGKDENTCYVMDVNKADECKQPPNCWGTRENCCPSHSGADKNCKKDPESSCNCECDGNGDGAPCGTSDSTKCATKCNQWANTACSSNGNGGNGRNSGNVGSPNDNSVSQTTAALFWGILGAIVLAIIIGIIISGGIGSKKRKGNRTRFKGH